MWQGQVGSMPAEPEALLQLQNSIFLVFFQYLDASSDHATAHNVLPAAKVALSTHRVSCRLCWDASFQLSAAHHPPASLSSNVNTMSMAWSELAEGSMSGWQSLTHVCA